jgi:hypothetical protein
MKPYLKQAARVVCAGLALAFAGCAVGRAPVNGIWYSDVKDGYLATSNAACTKQGTGTATSYLGVVAVGDASVSSAATNAGITKIHHIDYHTKSMLGIIATYTVTVYGE